MYRSHSFPLFFVAVAATLLLSCKEEDVPTTPGPTGPDTTSHEFVWEVDTLFWPGTSTPAFFTAQAMYPLSATNVYMVGYSTGLARCWHWDGDEWSVFNLGPGMVGTEIVDIDGVDSSYIVFASQEPGITEYTGVVALENGNVTMLPLPLGDEEGNGTRYRTCLHVAARDEIYLGSVQGVQRYNGVEWEWLLDSTETTGNEFYPQYIYKFPDGTLEMVSQKHANALSQAVQWQWGNGRFVAIDSFPTEVKGYNQNLFGYSIHESGQNIFSTGLKKTFIRKGDRWDEILDIGGSIITGSIDNLFVGWQLTNFWHYSGRTTVQLWGEFQKQVTGFRRINATTFIDDMLFVCGEIDPVQRTVVVLRGRQVE